jgi:hypothetical protein
VTVERHHHRAVLLEATLVQEVVVVAQIQVAQNIQAEQVVRV